MLENKHRTITVCTGHPTAEWESPAYLSNGLIGLRPGAQPLSPSLAVVSGYTESKRIDMHEAHAPAPYPWNVRLCIDGVSLHESGILAETQTLHMDTAELESIFTFQNVRIRVLQHVSRILSSVCIQEITLEAQRDVPVQIQFGPDFSGIPGEFHRVSAYDFHNDLRELLYLGGHDREKLGLCISVHAFCDGNEVLPVERGEFSIPMHAGQTLVLKQISSMVSQYYTRDCHLESKKQVSLGWMIGFDVLCDRHRARWASLWQACPVIEGDAQSAIAQKGIDVAFYGLVSSCNPHNLLGVSPFGLSRCYAYDGHIFWDMDVWMAHPMLAIEPDAVRSMVRYRVDRMEAARRHAALYGYDGIQYPWESGVYGEDATPPDADTSWGEQHIVPDVAMMVWEYCQVVQDEEFVHQNAWPVLREIARWIMSRGVMTERGFEIGDIVGVDEFSSAVKNNAHMNLMCRIALKAAILCAERIGVKPDAGWKAAFDRMILPTNEEGALVPHETGTMQKIADQYSPGSAHFAFLHGPEFYDAFSLEQFHKTYDCDEAIRVHLKPLPSNPCSSAAPGFTMPVFAAAAAFFGEREKAAKLFEESYTAYAIPPFENAKEYRKYKDGVLVTSYGAQLQAVIYGFCGLRVQSGNDWAVYPASLPNGWDKIVIERAYIGGRPARVEAVHGEKAVIRFLNEEDAAT